MYQFIFKEHYIRSPFHMLAHTSKYYEKGIIRIGNYGQKTIEMRPSLTFILPSQLKIAYNLSPTHQNISPDSK